MTRVSQNRLTGLIGGVALTLACLATPAASLASSPDFAVAARAGTPGVGLDLDLGLTPAFGVRVGFSGFDINHNIDTSDVDYAGRLKLATVTGLLDWYAFNGSFHLTAGVAGNDTKLDVIRTAKPGQLHDQRPYVLELAARLPDRSAQIRQLSVALRRLRLGKSRGRGQSHSLPIRCRRHLRRHARAST